MTPSERARAFTRARNRVVRDQVGLMKGTRDELARLLKEALRAVREALDGQPTNYEQWSLAQLGAEIRQALGEFERGGAAQLSTAAGKAWRLGEDLVDLPLEAAGTRIAAILPRIDSRQLQAMRTFLVDRIKDVSVQAANKITAELGLVVIGARTPFEAIAATQKILGEQTRERATTIVRTELGRAFSAASQARMASAAKIVPGLQKQWRRSGKTHPRLHHDLADGQIVDVDKPFRLRPFGKPIVELMYPRDPKAPAGETINCGCQAIPYMASWKVSAPGRKPGSPLMDDAVPVSKILERA